MSVADVKRVTFGRDVELEVMEDNESTIKIILKRKSQVRISYCQNTFGKVGHQIRRTVAQVRCV